MPPSHKIDNYFREDYFRGDAKYNLDLCFYLGDDVKRSHVMCNAKWNNNTEAAWNQYINDLAYETNVILSEYVQYVSKVHARSDVS